MMYSITDDNDPDFMEKFRLRCLNDPTMQALYTDAIDWADVPDHEPPFETDNWQEYLLQRKLSEWQEEPSSRRVRSVPSSPVHRSATIPAYSVPSSPLHRSFSSVTSAFGFPTPAPLTIPACNQPVPPPATPVFSAIPKRHPRLLEAIREVDSASHTPDRTRTPSPMPKLPAVAVKTAVPTITHPPPIQGVWKERQQLQTILQAAPILSKTADPNPEKRTVFLKDLPLDTTIQDIHMAVRRPHGKLASVSCILHSHAPTMNVHLRFERWPAAKSAVKFGVVLHGKTYPAEYSTIQTE